MGRLSACLALALALGLAVLSGCAAVSDTRNATDNGGVETTAGEVIDEVEAQLRGYEPEYTVEVNSTTGGAHRLVRKGNRTKTIQTNPGERRGDIFAVSDEHGIWDYDSSENHYHKERLSSLDESNFPIEILKAAMNTTNASLRGTETVEGGTAYVLSFTDVDSPQLASELPGGFKVVNATYRVSAESLLPIEASIEFSENRTVFYTNFTFTSVSDTAFEPPEDARFLGTGTPLRIPYIAEVVAAEDVPENATVVEYENSPASGSEIVTSLLEEAYENGSASVRVMNGSRADESFSEVIEDLPFSPSPDLSDDTELSIPGNYIRYRNETIFLHQGVVPL